MTVDLASLFAADHAVSQSELSEAISFLGNKTRAAFSVSNALVGDIPAGESGEIDGFSDELTGQIVVLVSECPYRPAVGQKIRLASGRVVRIRQVSDDPSGVTYPIQAGPEHG
jgi:hypothetical protein